jgi:hypothetical protein
MFGLPLLALLMLVGCLTRAVPTTRWRRGYDAVAGHRAGADGELRRAMPRELELRPV